MNNISFVGSGNIAYHLSEAFKGAGLHINSISSRNELSGKQLAESLSSQFCKIEDIDPNIDLVIITVSDDSIAEVIEAIPSSIRAAVHTSGAIPIELFGTRFNNSGVFYPLQSFSKIREVDISNVPFLIEANNPVFQTQLVDLAQRITSRVEIMGSEERKHLHLAAVIANNFVNYLASEAYSILENQGIDGSLIRPLMLETIERLESIHPKDMQTGPAKRNDKEVLKKHEELLNSNPKLQSLYRQISQLIMQKYNGSEL